MGFNSFYGANLSGLVNFNKKSFYGFGVSGGFNYVGEEAKGVFFSSLGNYTKRAKDYVIQIGLFNVVREVPENAFVLQIGLDNRAANNHSLIINVKNFLKFKIKKRKII